MSRTAGFGSAACISRECIGDGRLEQPPVCEHERCPETQVADAGPAAREGIEDMQEAVEEDTSRLQRACETEIWR
jgi:hypothetical protein